PQRQREGFAVVVLPGGKVCREGGWGSRGLRRQIVSILKECEAGVPVADLLRRHGISRATYFLWRSKYAGTTVSELKRIKELEGENATRRPWRAARGRPLSPGSESPCLQRHQGGIRASGWVGAPAAIARRP